MYNVDFIIMAAGNSSRFGNNKLLADFNGKPMFSYVLKAAKIAALNLKKDNIICRIFVVSRYQDIFDHINKYNEEINRSININTVYSEDSKNGISFTIKSGLQKAADKADYYVFFTSDQPCLKNNTIERLIKNTIKENYGIGSIIFDEVEGNPVIFNKKYKKELMQLEGDCGGRKVLKRHINDCLYVKADEKIELLDADTAKQMEDILTIYSKSSIMS